MSEKQLSDFEISVLRVLNGEDIPDLVAGAAIWDAAAFLKGQGYAEGTYQITQKGKNFLKELDNE